MTKHIAVPEELAERLYEIADRSIYRCEEEKAQLRALLDGPGVEPVATLVEPPLESMKDNFWMTEEDAIRLSKLPYGTRLYLVAPSAPVQAVPDGWQLVPKEPTPEMYQAVPDLEGEEGMINQNCECAACQQKHQPLAEASETDLRVYEGIADNFWKDKRIAELERENEALCDLLASIQETYGVYFSSTLHQTINSAIASEKENERG